MMLFYKGQKFTNKAYGEDAPAKWHGGEKGELMAKNSMMNLPYIIDGETIVTQSNSCLLYLGKKLGIDKEEFFFHNHQVLDQAMDLRNDTMTIVVRRRAALSLLARVAPSPLPSLRAAPVPSHARRSAVPALAVPVRRQGRDQGGLPLRAQVAPGGQRHHQLHQAGGILQGAVHVRRRAAERRLPRVRDARPAQ